MEHPHTYNKWQYEMAEHPPWVLARVDADVAAVLDVDHALGDAVAAAAGDPG